jgi:hypothetical protein
MDPENVRRRCCHSRECARNRGIQLYGWITNQVSVLFRTDLAGTLPLVCGA